MGTVHTEPPRNHPHLGTPSRPAGMRSAGVSATHDGDVERASVFTAAVLSSSPSSRSPRPRPELELELELELEVALALALELAAQVAAGGNPSAGSWAFSRSAMSRRLTRLSPATSSSGNHRASSLDPSTSLRRSPPVTVAR